MPPKRRIAVTVPAGPKLEQTANRLAWAEENGYDDAWFSDGTAPDTMTSIAALAHRIHRLRVGVAVTPVFTRSPTVLAATANVLGQVLPGRFVMGLGASSQNMMTGWAGIPYEKPLTRVRETATMVRSMLAGEKSDFDGEVLSSHGYRQMPLDNPPPVYLAALRPKMIEMAAEVGDGVIFNLWPKKALPKMIEHVHAGAARAGKDGAEVEVVNRFMVLVTDDKAEARQRFRQSFAPYYATPVYNKFLAWAGYEEEAAQIAEGWAERDRAKTTGALEDGLIDDIGIIGTADECREKLKWALDTGIHTAIIAPLSQDPAEVQRTFEAFRPEVFDAAA
ncbi:MAG: LLM class flavin-dependent oxidoreductase [Minwuia sp.]|uniref:LLM class flavin-dependent oxidoreductase n=1 Tax=Minwuia sp. TaxID=2493630 RepID=UPI003A87ED78